MKKEWKTPQFYMETFELSQYVAATCGTNVTKNETVVLGCKHPSHVDGQHGHTWTLENLFTTKLECENNAGDSEEQLIAYGKNVIGGDANSWGSGQHGPTYNTISFDEIVLFQS
ncbi:hypothetical protein [Blautia obeum]|uniref:hypothetical protein n=1 Tax=Blautia obeum TaxID=40520 RepID=UPI003D0689F7